MTMTETRIAQRKMTMPNLHQSRECGQGGAEHLNANEEQENSAGNIDQPIGNEVRHEIAAAGGQRLDVEEKQRKGVAMHMQRQIASHRGKPGAEALLPEQEAEPGPERNSALLRTDIAN